MQLGGAEIIEVIRPVEEVTAATFLGSLEGKCLTDGHGNWISSANAKWYCCGHVQNVRESEPVGGDVCIVGDLFVIDENAIRKIANGKRQLNCGYNYTLERRADGTYTMQNLVANHVALVDSARAGSDFRILDHALQQGRLCKCPREVARVTDRAEAVVLKEANFGAAARRYLGRNIMEVRKNR